ncbi:hypothetical protein [Kosmotoga sp. DU53]|uniref:hypothetical protein n=1 Tax=Kosmotoga sp. DU53 TaxID=1310160 RepID=UPI0007C4C5E9|nr:hypothetical protein [Kosmotoga sp. DU53]OAA21515.1 hypothetical protein DU53_05780 [Kosmotoga sp. DU53]
MRKLIILFLMFILIFSMGISKSEYLRLTVKGVISLALKNSVQYQLSMSNIKELEKKQELISLFSPRLSTFLNFQSTGNSLSLGLSIQIPISPILAVNKRCTIQELKREVEVIRSQKTSAETLKNALNLFSLLSNEKSLLSMYETLLAQIQQNSFPKETIREISYAIKKHKITMEEMEFDLKNMLGIPQNKNILIGEELINSDYFNELVSKIHNLMANTNIPKSPDVLLTKKNARILELERETSRIMDAVSFFVDLNRMSNTFDSGTIEFSYGIRINLLDLPGNINLSIDISKGKDLELSLNTIIGGLNRVRDFNDHLTANDKEMEKAQMTYEHNLRILYQKLLVYRDEYEDLISTCNPPLNGDPNVFLSYFSEAEKMLRKRALYIQTVLELAQLLMIF